MFNLGHGTHWLPLMLMHPGTWPTFTIMYRLKRLRAPDLSARQFIDQMGYTGRARLLAQLTLTAHLPGSIDEVGLLGFVEDGILTIENGLNHRIAEGYDSLIAYLGASVDIELGFRVNSVRYDAGGVTVTGQDGREVSARACVSTLPLGVLQSGAVRFLPELPESKQTAMRCLKVGNVVKILLRFKERFWPKWLANLCCGDGPVTLYWPVFYNRGASTDDKPPVLIAYATGPRAERLSAMSEDEAAATVVADLARLLPKSDPRSFLEAHRRVDWGTDPLACGGYSFVLPGRSGGPRTRLAAADTGALFWAGSATQTTPIAETVEAAFLSGQRAAKEVVQYLNR
jgi:monoamine oxidase